MKKSIQKPWLVLAAAEFEVEKSLEVLRAQGQPFDFLELGIGSISAAYCLGFHKEKMSTYDKVIYIGTCGIFGDFEGLQLVRPKKCFYSDPAERFGLAYSIPGQYPVYDLAALSGDSNADLTWVDVLSSGVITLTAEKSPPKLDPSRPLVENLELYGASRCLASLKNLGGVYIYLAVTNNIGPSAHKQWQDHYKKADQMTSETLQKEHFLA